ncbi:hypothetical protein [Pedobacter aquatilis]|uniref:hypothetical protein n=1 Tax=Pedobacter aquatilis TaxID=351343 RepID=UPI00292F70C9|nr:hypothetical protein [Pedobacter aquatilis]
MKKLFLILLMVCTLSSYAQYKVDKTVFKTKSKTYRISRIEYNGFTSFEDANYVRPKLNDLQTPSAFAQELLTWDKEKIKSIVKAEVTSKLTDKEKNKYGKMIEITFDLNSADLSIKSFRTSLFTDEGFNYKLLANLDKKLRKEIVFKPRKDISGYQQKSPVFYVSYGIKLSDL